MTQIRQLVVFDFSGTLSSGPIAFTRETCLLAALKMSGLWQVGLKSLTMFWDKIINPTWQQGSTTSIGYAALLTRQLQRLTQSPEQEIALAAARFTQCYFDACPIEPAWIPLLSELIAHPTTGVLIATDHYADATPYLLGQLDQAHLTGKALADASAAWDGRSVLVGNSADLGALKATPEFWEIVRRSLHCSSLSQVIVVDDFGGNESAQDSYTASAKVLARQQAMRGILTTVFACPVRMVPFVLGCAQSGTREDLTQEFHSLIINVATAMKEFLR